MPPKGWRKLTQSTLAKRVPHVRRAAQTKGAAENKRVDVVSGKLCDDVIKYLAPTLEQHKGCTIIDFDPGRCLFSSKLHDYLKPKEHILLEPDESYFKPHIQKLLNTPDNTYQYCNWRTARHNAIHWDYKTRRKSGHDLLLDRPPLSSGDPKRLQFDPSVLVIGNVARRPGKGSINIDNSKNLKVQDVVFWALIRDLFHQGGLFEAGLVRMLWWVPDMFKPHIVTSNTLNNRTSFSVGLNMAFEASEVAGVKDLPSLLNKIHHTQRKRLETLDVAAAQDVKQRMEEQGMSVPHNRRFPNDRVRNSTVEEEVKGLSPFENTAEDVASLDKDITAAATRLEEISVWTSSMKVARAQHKEKIASALESLEYSQSRTFGPKNASGYDRTDKSDEMGRARKIVLLDFGLQTMNLEASYQDLRDADTDNTELVRLRKRILDLDTHFSNLLKATEKVSRDVHRLLEDQLAYYSGPLLSRDRRAYEPLQAKPAEFYPKSDVALIDFTPKPIDLSVPDLADSRQGANICTQLITHLMSAKRQSLPAALERIAVNAGKDLIPQVPAITDVRRGGRLNPENLLTRMLTPEMVEGLVKAWFEWPFRPQSWELELKSGEVEKVEESREGEVEGRSGGE